MSTISEASYLEDAIDEDTGYLSCSSSQYSPRTMPPTPSTASSVDSNSSHIPSFLKQGLKMSIQARRKQEGKGELTVDFRPPPPEQVSVFRKTCKPKRGKMYFMSFEPSFLTSYTGQSINKVPSNMHKMRRFRSPCACAKYHSDREGSDQTARMRSLIWAFAVRICPHFPKLWTHFRYLLTCSETLEDCQKV